MNKKSLFGKIQLKNDDFRVFELHQTVFSVKRLKEGWILKTSGVKEETGINPDFSDGKYYQTGKSEQLLFVPSLPPKPLVFKGTGLFVSPGLKMMFYLKLPLFLKVYYSKIQPEKLLSEIPLQPLSHTWFGEPDSGETAFSMGSEYDFNLAELTSDDHTAVCPVAIQNNSNVMLHVERLIIRTENLTLYKNEDKLLTSMISLDYKGKETISSANYQYSKKIHGEKPEIIAKPENNQLKDLLKINFHFIRNLYKSEQ